MIRGRLSSVLLDWEPSGRCDRTLQRHLAACPSPNFLKRENGRIARGCCLGRASRLGLRRIVMISPGDSGVHWVGSQERKYDPLLWSNSGRRLRLLGLVRFPRQKEAIFSVILAVSNLLKINRSPFFATYWL